MKLEYEEWQRPGRRVAFWRTLTGMSQSDLAVRVERTQGWVSQVESGVISLDSRSMIDALAEALGVHRNKITGEPTPARSAEDMAAVMSVQQIRQALLVPDSPTPPRELPILFDMADRAMRARMWCTYGELGRLLAPVLADARTLYDSGQHRDQALQLIVQAGVTGALALKPLGEVDLAQRLADRAFGAARELGHPVYIAAAAFADAQCVFAVGNARQQSLRIAERAADQLAVDGDNSDDAAAWGTMLHLHAALSAAALHDKDATREHLDVAGQLVQGVSEVRDPWRMEATPDNVDTWAVGIAVESGTPELATVLAGRVDGRRLQTPQRRARLHLDNARALFATRRHDDAVRALLTAEQIAPSDIRRRPTVREMTAFMVRSARRRGGSQELQELAQRVGVGPEDLATAA